MIDMIDEDDKDEYKEADKSSKKRKRVAPTEDEDFENKSAKRFEQQHAAATVAENITKKRTVDLLPIKTKDGSVVTRTEEVDYNSDDEDGPLPEDTLDDDADGEEEDIDSDDDVIKGEKASVL